MSIVFDVFWGVFGQSYRFEFIVPVSKFTFFRSMEEDSAHNEESYEEKNIVQSVVLDIERQVSINDMQMVGNEKLVG